MTWRDKLRPIVARVLAAGGGDKELLEEWHKRSSFGGASWPYRVWRDEIATQRGGRKKAKRKVRRMSKEEARKWMLERQMEMFR